MLSKELDAHLKALDASLASELPKLNAILRAAGLQELKPSTEEIKNSGRPWRCRCRRTRSRGSTRPSPVITSSTARSGVVAWRPYSSRKMSSTPAAWRSKCCIPSSPPLSAHRASCARLRQPPSSTHPHILSLHDSGERDGLLYYVMPYVDGESLRERLTREHQLPMEDALRIASDVADALGFAHAAGVVHRDIKPENILLAGRHAIVADFGIARAVQRAAGDTLTETGVTLGTPHYMSPEQASGEREIDARSDIYALGCVLYEMLTGEPPYAGPTVQSIVAKHMTAEVPSVRTLRPTAPPKIERVIARALAKSPADRYQDAGSMLRELEGVSDAATGVERQETPATQAPRRVRPAVWASAAALLAVVVAFAIWRSTAGTSTPSSPPTGSATASRSLAVLPFDDVGAAAESTYFADGITEEIIGAIGRIPGLRVISRTSAFAFKEKRGLTLRQIADSLKVGTILEGSVRRDGNRLRVIARLMDVAADSQLLTRDFNRELRDVFALQNEIAQDIASALRVRLTAASAAPGPAATTRDIEAYDLYLRGRAQWNQRTPSALREAVRLFEAALARDSMFVAAYVGLSDALTLNGILGGASPDAMAGRARTAAERALRLDSTNGGAHAALGHVLFNYLRQWRDAESHLRRALALDSTYNSARLWLGVLHQSLDRSDAAIALLKEALERDPLSPPIRTTLGRVLLSTGQVDSAIAQLRMSAEINPAWSFTYGLLGYALIARGERDEALDAFRRGAALGGVVDSALLAYGLAATGQRAAAQALLRAIESKPRDVYNLSSAVAMAYVALGDHDAAFRWLEKLGSGFGGLTFFRLPGLAAIRSDPRYARLLRELGLPN